ncbi:uncharacterized protein [Fopius arisanus]|uniref:Uncharacterized protein isoform X1 n=1 Tax=Fopius arisanus TaxID=64838 RepID=A0A9R1T6G9_9HYME|nr:PREDICTED: uncharacterized protein LOC105266933 isoform X1 [Fopius arisanus]
MSGIFNLFGATTVTPRTSQRAGSTDAQGRFSVKANALRSGSGPLKQGNTSKPRGLSIRSNNDLNVCTPSQKTSTLAKGKINTFDCASRPLTPRRKQTASKLQIVREKQLKSISPPCKSPYFNLTIKQKGTDDLLFKKPVTPKSNQRPRFIYPEPESIPIFIDDNIHLYDLNEDLELVKKMRKTKEPFIDEGFESDSELAPTPPKSPVPIEFRHFNFSIADADLDAPDIPICSDSDNDD